MHLEVLPRQSHSSGRHARLTVLNDLRLRVQRVADWGAADVTSTLWTRIPRRPDKPPQRLGTPPLRLGLASEVSALHNAMDCADPGLTRPIFDTEKYTILEPRLELLVPSCLAPHFSAQGSVEH